MAFHYYISVKGTKQGQFKGESGKNGQGSKWGEVLGFQYGEKSPRDQASGLASGKRQHSPLVIVKQVDSASPLFFQALRSSEVLSEVVLQKVLQPLNGNGGGKPEPVAERITLTNATISSIDRYTALPVGHVSHPKDGYQKLQFNFEDIKIEKLGA